MFKKVALVVVVLLVVLFAYAATRPDSFHVQRSATIKAPPEKIFALIADYHHWGEWSPYEKLDPAMKKAFSGAASGQGSVYEWEGNSKAGKGRIEITQVSAPSTIKMNLDMIKPIEGHNKVEFTLQPNGDSTNVTWAMAGSSPYVAKVMGMFFNMDQMIGGQFEDGLATLKTVAEK